MNQDRDDVVYYTTTTRLALYYKQEVNTGDNLHPAVDEVLKWFTKFIQPDDMEKFYRRILDNCDFFPRIKDLSKLYQNFDITLPAIGTTDPPRINCDPQLTEESLAKNFVEKHGIKYDHDEPVSMDVLMDDDSVMTPDQMLHKYGYKLCADVWEKIGEMNEAPLYILMAEKKRLTNREFTAKYGDETLARVY